MVNVAQYLHAVDAHVLRWRVVVYRSYQFEARSVDGPYLPYEVFGRVPCTDDQDPLADRTSHVRVLDGCSSCFPQEPPERSRTRHVEQAHHWIENEDRPWIAMAVEEKDCCHEGDGAGCDRLGDVTRSLRLTYLHKP